MDRKTGRVVFEQDPILLRTAEFEPRFLKFLQSTMEKVITSPTGTGKNARIPGVRVAGKTGTSENPQGDAHSWFTAFAPVEDPKVSVIVLVENGGYGAVVSAPIAKRLMEAVLGQEVTPWQTPTPGVTPETDSTPTPVATPVP